MIMVGEIRLDQQLLDDHLRLLVFTFAEVVVSYASLRVGEVQRGPVVVVEGSPYRKVVVDRDRVIDPQVLHGAVNVVRVVFESEFGGVYRNHGQIVIGVFFRPGAEVGQLPQPVDADVGPEV